MSEAQKDQAGDEELPSGHGTMPGEEVRAKQDRKSEKQQRAAQADELDRLREGIDSVDDRIHQLLIERAELVLQVGKFKERHPGAPFYRPEREARIHRRLEKRHKGHLPVAAVHRIFREIISASLNLEKPLSIAYLGPEATFTHQAALKHFGHSFRTFPTRSIREVFHEVEVGRADFGVVPVENSIEGVVHHTLDSFADSPLSVCAEVHLPVVHNLISREMSVKKIKTLYGHFRSLSECRKWLGDNLPHVEIVETNSTAMAASKARKRKHSAAIAGTYAADHFHLNILSKHIEDSAENEDRFLVVGHHQPGPSGRDKTSLMFSFRDAPGFLHQVLGVFADGNINLTRIESRPSRKRAWDHLFFVDLDGHQSDATVAEALERLESMPGVRTRILGSYPWRAL